MGGQLIPKHLSWQAVERIALPSPRRQWPQQRGQLARQC